MPESNHFEGEISAVSKEDVEFLRRTVASGLQTHGARPQWEKETTDAGMMESKKIVGFLFNVAIGLSSNIVASAIYDEITAERPAATMTTHANGGCTIAVDKSSVYLAPLNPKSAEPVPPVAPEDAPR